MRRDRIVRRARPPLLASVYFRFLSSQRNSTSPATALNASTVVSTYARPIAPFVFEARICVESTRSPPPNTYGAENDPSAFMKTSSAEPATAGISSGSVTRRSLCQVLAPRPDAASSSVASNRSSPADTNRKTYTYIVYACTNTIAPTPLSLHGASAIPSDALHHARDESALAIEKQKRDDADERWQRGGKRRDRAKQPAARETRIVPAETRAARRSPARQTPTPPK